MLWIRGEIAPQEQFLPFPTIFLYIFLIKGVYLHIHLLNLVVQFVFSSILSIIYVELRISRSVSEGPFKFEITRVDCIHTGQALAYIQISYLNEFDSICYRIDKHHHVYLVTSKQKYNQWKSLMEPPKRSGF